MRERNGDRVDGRTPLAMNLNDPVEETPEQSKVPIVGFCAPSVVEFVGWFRRQRLGLPQAPAGFLLSSDQPGKFERTYTLPPK